MPRVLYLYGSGICLLLSATALGQAPLPKNPTLQQVVDYRLQQQRKWSSRQLPRNSVLYRAVTNPASAHHPAALEQKNASSLTPPVVPKAYGQSPTPSAQSPALQHNLIRDGMRPSPMTQSRWWRNSQYGPSNRLLRNVLPQPELPPK